MKNDPNIGEGCEIKQTPQGVYVDGVKQKGAIDVQNKKELPSMDRSSNNLSSTFVF